MTHLLLFSLSEHMDNLWVVIIVGAIAGTLLAGLILKGRSNGLVLAIILGILGGWLCNTFFGQYLTFISNGLLRAIVGATIGALILTFVVNLIFSKQNERDRTEWEA